MRAVQTIPDEYLESCREMTPDQIIRFLDDFRRLHAGTAAPSKLISMKAPEDLLEAFKAKDRLNGTPYQTQIKALMKNRVLSEPD